MASSLVLSSFWKRESSTGVRAGELLVKILPFGPQIVFPFIEELWDELREVFVALEV